MIAQSKSAKSGRSPGYFNTFNPVALKGRAFLPVPRAAPWAISARPFRPDALGNRKVNGAARQAVDGRRNQTNVCESQNAKLRACRFAFCEVQSS
jgi:hypothetical protein